MSSRPDTPGKRYLLPPEKPTTSWGNTGPTVEARYQRLDQLLAQLDDQTSDNDQGATT